MQVRGSGDVRSFLCAVAHVDLGWDMTTSMDDSPAPKGENNLDEVTASIFHAIGRNLVTLQEIESRLRFLAERAALSGPASRLVDVRAAKEKRLRKRGLGELAEHYGKEILMAAGSQHVPTAEPDEVKEVHIGFSFRVEMQAEDLTQRKDTLRRVVVERNRLVHQLLNDWRRDSLESGLALLHRLDAQDLTLSAELQTLREQCNGMIQAVQTVVDFLGSEEARRFFEERAEELDSGPISSGAREARRIPGEPGERGEGGDRSGDGGVDVREARGRRGVTS